MDKMDEDDAPELVDVTVREPSPAVRDRVPITIVTGRMARTDFEEEADRS